jgi:hypothetical protein
MSASTLANVEAPQEPDLVGRRMREPGTTTSSTVACEALRCTYGVGVCAALTPVTRLADFSCLRAIALRPTGAHGRTDLGRCPTATERRHAVRVGRDAVKIVVRSGVKSDM